LAAVLTENVQVDAELVQIGVGHVQEPKSDEVMDLLIVRRDEASADQDLPAFQHQGVVGTARRRPPVGLSRAADQFVCHREEGAAVHAGAHISPGQLKYWKTSGSIFWTTQP